SLLVAVTVVLTLILAGLLYLPVRLLDGWLEILRRLFRRRRIRPTVWEIVLAWLFSIALFVPILPAEVFVRLTAFRRLRRSLLAFLASRPVIAGAGTVGPDGRFHLSPRVAAVRSVCSCAAEVRRAVFKFGHLFKGTLGVLLGDHWSYGQLFRRRQRLQVGVGDSNMAQHAEYLKIGTTLLVLEAIEAGALNDAP